MAGFPTTRTDTALVEPDLGDDAEALRLRVREVVDDVIAPNAENYDDDAAWPETSFRAAVDAGAVGLPIPEEFGGAAASVVHQCVAIEEIAWGCGATASCVQANWMAAWLLARSGSPAQQERYLPDLATGQRQGSFAVTEAIGRHQPVPPTVVSPAGDGIWEVTGHKAFVGNGGVADFCLFTADATLPDAGGAAPTMFVADLASDGFTVERVVPKMSVRGYQTADFRFDGLQVTDNDMLGQLGDGFRLAGANIDIGRVVYAAQATGVARRAIDEMATYANIGRDEDRHLAQYQAIQFMVAEAATAVAGARALMYRAAVAVDADEEAGAPSAAAAKYAASQAAKLAVDNALQVHGAYGLTEDAVTERLYRDQRVTEIGVGANEAMKTVVARSVLGATR